MKYKVQYLYSLTIDPLDKLGKTIGENAKMFALAKLYPLLT